MDLVERYLPKHFYVRLPGHERAWRGRIVLLLWALGYPLAMAWSLGLTTDQEMVDVYRDAVARLDDERLVAQLDATKAARGDGSEFSFWTIGA